jgi:hypothetical protein
MVFAATWHMPLPKYGYISVSPCALASKAASWSRSAELQRILTLLLEVAVPTPTVVWNVRGCGVGKRVAVAIVVVSD